jgi:hypothetical protein
MLQNYIKPVELFIDVAEKGQSHLIDNIDNERKQHIISTIIMSCY